MRKILLIVAAVVAVFLVGCTETVDYKAKSEQLAKHVEELCQQQADTAAVIAVMDSIQALEENVVATGDSALIADYNAVKKTAYNHYAVYVASLKLKNGIDRQEVIDDVTNDVLTGKASISAVTAAIDSANNAKK